MENRMILCISLLFLNLCMFAETIKDNVDLLLYPIGWKNEEEIYEYLEFYNDNFLKLIDVDKEFIKSPISGDVIVHDSIIEIKNNNFEVLIPRGHSMIKGDKISVGEPIINGMKNSYILLIMRKSSVEYKTKLKNNEIHFFGTTGDTFYAPTDGKFSLYTSDDDSAFCGFQIPSFIIDIDDLSLASITNEGLFKQGQKIGNIGSHRLDFTFYDKEYNDVDNLVVVYVNVEI